MFEICFSFTDIFWSGPGSDDKIGSGSDINVLIRPDPDPQKIQIQILLRFIGMIWVTTHT